MTDEKNVVVPIARIHKLRVEFVGKDAVGAVVDASAVHRKIDIRYLNRAGPWWRWCSYDRRRWCRVTNLNVLGALCSTPPLIGDLKRNRYGFALLTLNRIAEINTRTIKVRR